MSESTWESLHGACLSCRQCALADTRHNVVVGVGNPKAEVLFIGEGPGENEDLKGEPFVGRGGKLLDQMLAAVGLSRHHNIYIANIVKCRPPQNRDPKPEEQAACTPWLEQQIALIDPKIIVCLGRIAAGYIIDPDFKMMKQHGQWFEKDGRLMMGMLHPAAVLRNPNQRSVAFADFVTLRDKIEEIGTHTKLIYPE